MFIGLLGVFQTGMAMKIEANTSLSATEQAALRQAVVDYKKNRSRGNAEQIINRFANQYPNDSFVRSKFNEKAKFDASEGIQPAKGIIVLPAKQVVGQSANLSSQEQAELRQAMVDYKKNRSRTIADQIINKYASLYPNDPLVKSKLNERAKFDQQSSVVPASVMPASVMQPMTPAVTTPNLYIYNNTDRSIRVTPMYAEPTLAQGWPSQPLPQPQLTTTIRPYGTNSLRVDTPSNFPYVKFQVLEEVGGQYREVYGGSLDEKIAQGQVVNVTYGVNPSNAFIDRATNMPAKTIYETGRINQ